MNSLAYLLVKSLLLLAGSVTALLLVRYFVRAFNEYQTSQSWNCLPPASWPTRLPLGLEFLHRLNEADKKGILPSEFVKVVEEAGSTTFHTFVLGTRSVVTVEPKNVQAVLATQFDDFELGEGRRGNFFPVLGLGIFTADGNYWAHSRATLRPQFTKSQISDLHMNERHLKEMFHHISPQTSGWSAPVDLKPLFFCLTLDTATEFLFGQSVGSQRTSDRAFTPESGHEDWSLLGSAFDKATHTLSVRARLADLYFLHNPRSFRNNIKIIHAFTDHYVAKILESRTEKSHEECSERYIFLRELANSTQDPIELRNQLLNVLLAGRDTTAGLLGWTFYLLAGHPEVFKRIREAVINTFGSYETPKDLCFETLKGCKPLQNLMREVLRLYPSVPFNSRKATKDTTIPTGGGPDGTAPVFVRKGEEVGYSVYVMQRRKDIWGADADEFRPERFETHRHGWEYLPFNGGPRICLGQQFALTEAGYSIVRMIQKYDAIEFIASFDHSAPIRHSLSLTDAPYEVPVRLHEAATSTDSYV